MAEDDAPWKEDSGIIPAEFKVLVLPDEDELTSRTNAMGLAVPHEYAARHLAGSVTGTIVDMSTAAFSYHEWPEDAKLPQIGDRVVFARYAGMLIKGKPYVNDKGRQDQREYRLLSDKDVAGVLTFEKPLI